mgnify:CR=1 FL=1
MAKAKKRKVAPGDVASNRYASYRFELLERLECGIALQGTEVKALREGGAQLKDGYALIRDGELFLHNVHIPPYAPAAQANHEPARDRRLLAKRNQIDNFADQIKQKGLTLVPTRIYFKDGRAKVEIALAKGKDRFDKRESIKQREADRTMQRAVRQAVRSVRRSSAAGGLRSGGRCAAPFLSVPVRQGDASEKAGSRTVIPG